MYLESFIARLDGLKPSIEILRQRGYDDDEALELIYHEYSLKPIPNKNIYNSDLLNFLNNYDLKNFRIRNINFSDILRYVQRHLIVGGFDGGHLGLNEKTGAIYIIYSDEESNIHEIFVENEFQFFEILLIIAEYSSKVSEGVIDPFSIEVKQVYYQRCYNICPISNCELFF